MHFENILPPKKTFKISATMTTCKRTKIGNTCCPKVIIKWVIFGLFFIYFRYFIKIVQFLQQQCENDLSSMQCRDSNSRPLDHQSPLITTRQGPTYFPKFGQVFTNKDISVRDFQGGTSLKICR